MQFFDQAHQAFDLGRSIECEFRGHVLPFWKNMRDTEYGGYYGWLDYNLNFDPKAVKGAILNDRIMWFFSNAYLNLRDEDSLQYADHAYRFFMDHILDTEYGGIYWSLHYDGTPDDTTKHTYNQAFAIYALSSYYEASNDPEAIETAFSVEQVIETRCRDEEGYLEAFTRDFHPAENESSPREAEARLADILDLFLHRIYNPEKAILEPWKCPYHTGRMCFEVLRRLQEMKEEA